MAKSLRREISSIRSLYASWYRLHKIFVFQTERDHPKNVGFIRKLCWGGLINIRHFLFVKCDPYLMSCKNLSIEGEEETGKWRGSPPECHTFRTCQNKPKPEMTPKSQKLFVTTITQMNCKSDLIAKTPRYRQERGGVYCSLSICVTLGLVFWRKRLWVSFPVAVRSIHFMSQLLFQVLIFLFLTILFAPLRTLNIETTTQISTTRSEHQCEAPQNQNEDISYKQCQF